MKRITGFAVAAGAAIVLAGATVLAQPYGGFGPGHGGQGPFAGARGPGAGPGMRGGGNVAERLATRKAELKITAEQEPQWNAFVAAVTEQATAMQARRESMFKLPPGERFAQRETMRSQHLEQHKVVDAAFDQLSAVLTPEQKALFEQQGCGMGGYGRGKMMSSAWTRPAYAAAGAREPKGEQKPAKAGFWQIRPNDPFRTEEGPIERDPPALDATEPVRAASTSRR